MFPFLLEISVLKNVDILKICQDCSSGSEFWFVSDSVIYRSSKLTCIRLSNPCQSRYEMMHIVKNDIVHPIRSCEIYHAVQYNMTLSKSVEV